MPTSSEYLKIPVTDFTEEASLPFDLYFEPTPGKVQKLAEKKGSFSLRLLSASVKKSLQWLFLKKDDYRTYVNFTVGQGGQPYTPHDDIKIKLNTLNQHIENRLTEFRKQGLNLKYLDLVPNTLNNVLHLLIENPITNKLYEKIEILEANNFHSISVALWTYILALHLGWSGEPTAFRVILCALLHDVGANENEMDLQDARLLESHVLRGRDILLSIPGMPSEVITVTHQHHELVDGTGYPQKLFLDDIHPVARLVALTNRFHEIYLSTRKQQKLLPDVFQIFKKEQLHYDLRFFKTLEDVLAYK